MKKQSRNRHSRRRYGIAFTLLLLTEVCIALFVRDRFVRPYVGDALVAPLVYCFVQTLLRARPLPVAAGTFLFCCLVEILQAAGFAGHIGAEHNGALGTLVGRTFDWGDILAYAAGCAAVLLAEGARVTTHSASGRS